MKNKILLILLFVGVFFISAGIFVSKENIKGVQSQSISSSVVTPTGFLKTKESIEGEKAAVSVQRTVFVAAVLDGDTIQTDSGEKIRYLGINSPETDQPYAKEATEENKKLVLGKTVGLETDIEVKDRYGRTLAYAYQNDVFVNLEMIKRGFAVSETIQPNVLHQDQIVAAQKAARDSCAGMWEGLCSSGSNSASGNGRCVKIASINADAAGNDNTNKNDEWIELQNTCMENQNLADWLLKDSSASNKYVFKQTVLSSQQKILLHSGCGTDSLSDLYWQCPEGKYAVWNNAGDHAFLYNNNGELVSDYQY